MGGFRRTGKVERRPDTATTVSARDEVVCVALAKAKVLRSADLVSLGLFPSLAMARRRMRKLCHAGISLGFVEQPHLPTQFTLGPLGRALLGDAAKKTLPKTLSALRGYGTHHFMAVRFWALLAGACHQATHLELERFDFEWELRARPGPDTLTPHRPDALYSIVTESAQHVGWVEVDCATESPSYVAATKFAVFARIVATGTAIAGVAPTHMVLLAPTLRRLQSLARAAQDLRVPVLCRVFDEHTENLTLGNGWMPRRSVLADSPEAIGLLDLEAIR